MYMISRSLQFVSCTVHRVFLMLSISSEVDYVPAIKLTTYGLELTFFFVCGGGGGGSDPYMPVNTESYRNLA